MDKVGTWTYWFKSVDGFDISHASNKNNIPKGFDWVQQFRVHKSNGDKDYELIHNGKIVWVKKNVNKLSECETMQMGHDLQRVLHELLKVDYPEKEYKKIFEKKVKGCKIK